MRQGFSITVFFVCLLSATLLFAQFETAEVLGTVRDPSGAVIARAAATLTNQATGVQSKVVTAENGDFDFFNVQVGRYSLTVEHAGFSKVTTNDVTVDVGARQRVDVSMKVGAVTESVEVTSAASALETDSSDRGQVVSTAAVTELPLNGRNYADLALLDANAVKSPLADSFSATGTPREGAFNVNGMRSTYNNFLLDGLDNNAYGTSNQGYSAQLVQLSPDALAEFKIITGNYSAEYGRVGGAVVNAVMKSGTNELHGSAYEYLRNTDLDAIGFTFSPAVFQKPTLQRNQFGFTAGGPIIKNKLFYFADYEGFRQLQRYLNFDSIPDMNDRNGLPAPNGPGRSNNDEALLLIRDYGDKFDAKIDGQINDRMTAFIRFSQRKDLQYYAPDLTGPSGGDGNGYIHVIDQNASLGYTWTITPTSLFDARLGFSHLLGGKTPPYVGGPSLSVQRQLAKDTVFTLTYNGNHSLRLPIIGDYNEAAPYNPSARLTYTARVPIPTFGPITWLDPAGDNHYNGLSANVEHRFAKDLYFLNSFTWGSAIGDSEQALEYYAGYFQANPQNIHDLAAEVGPSSFDEKFNNVSTLIYQLPFGKSRKYLSSANSLTDAFLGGRELTSINTGHTGTPIDVVYSASGNNIVSSLSNDYRGQPFLRPNVTGSAVSRPRSEMLNNYFAGYTFSTPSASDPFGDVGRNAFRAPNFDQWDCSIDKNFQIRERARLQFRAEFFNFLNHTNFGIPDTKTTDAAFGTIRTTFPSRQGQFALKLMF